MDPRLGVQIRSTTPPTSRRNFRLFLIWIRCRAVAVPVYAKIEQRPPGQELNAFEINPNMPNHFKNPTLHCTTRWASSTQNNTTGDTGKYVSNYAKYGHRY